MQNDILNDETGISTNLLDKNGNQIFVGSCISYPFYEKCFDCFPGVVKYSFKKSSNDNSRHFIVYCKSTRNRNGAITYDINEHIAAQSIVIDTDYSIKSFNYKEKKLTA